MPSRSYDLIVVGGGLGGLITATLLSREGMKVLVLEQDKQLGGCLQSFSFQKTYFDSCVHYIGSMNPGQTQYRLFDYMGILDELSLQDLDLDGFDRIYFGDDPQHYPHATGREQFIESLVPYFPDMRHPLGQYMDYIERLLSQFPLYRLQLGDPWAKQPYLSLSLDATLRSLIPSPKLRAVLTGSSLLYAGNVAHSPFYQHALVWNSYLEGPRKMLPGTARLTKALSQKIREQGGEILTRSKLVKIHCQQGLVDSLELENGERYFTRNLISAIHPNQTMDMVDSEVLRPAFRKRIQQIPHTISGFVLYLVLAPGTVPYRNHNLYWHRNLETLADPHHALHPWPQTYGLFFHEDQNYPGYAKSLSVMTYMDYQSLRPWWETVNRATEPKSRPPSYIAFKESKEDALLDLVCRHQQITRSWILGKTSATPLTIRDYTGSPQGSLYGWQKSYLEPASRMISSRSRIKNLFFTGQNINLHGVLGVSISALDTAGEIVGLPHLLKKIQQSSPTGDGSAKSCSGSITP